MTDSNLKCNTLIALGVQMTEQTKYEQLQPEERMTIARMVQRGSSMRAMARMLGRSVSTVSRKLGRNTDSSLAYALHTAQMCCAGRRQAGRDGQARHTERDLGPGSDAAGLEVVPSADSLYAQAHVS
jgi:DNA-binding CsgD family transcriptional regulator